MAIGKTVKLSSGFQMPAIGLGTSFSTDSSPPDQAEVEHAAKIALHAGYRNIDCAPVYQNEAAVGRDQSIWDSTGRACHYKQTPYTLFPEDENGDIIMKPIPIASTWEAMENLVRSGKARSIGVSNFCKMPQVEELSSTAKIVPALNQYTNTAILLQKRAGIMVFINTWSSLTTDRSKNLNVANDPNLIQIAQSINITPAQVALSWAVQRGRSAIPKSSNLERLRLNLEIVELPGEIIEQFDKLEEGS